MLASLVSVVTWHSVRRSNSENALIYGLFPLAEFKIHFRGVKAIEVRFGSLVVEPDGVVVPIPAKFLGFDRDPVVAALRSYSWCLEVEGEHECAEMGFAWP